MKYVFGVMVGMFAFVVWPFSDVWVMLLSKLLGDGAWQSYIYPLYGGIILLSGLIVFCTVLICEQIRGLLREVDQKVEPKESVE